MKRGTPRHRKMRHLAEILNIPLAQAVGIMEMIWHSAGQETPRGDIGTAKDREIAAWCDWTKKPVTLVDALVKTGWLDRNDEYRLIVHDWPDHAEQAVKKWLDRRKEDYLSCYAERPDIVRTTSGQKLDESQPKVIPRADVRPGFGDGIGSDAVVVSFGDQEYSETSARVKAPRGEMVATDDHGWHEYMGVFLAAGKKLNERDVEKALRAWISLDITEQLQAVEDIKTAALERTAQFVPFPVNHLNDKPWTRRGPDRLLPDPPRKNDKQAEAERIFLARQKANGRG